MLRDKLLIAMLISAVVFGCATDGPVSQNLPKDASVSGMLPSKNYIDYAPIKREFNKVESSQIVALLTPCKYKTADELMASCPTQDEIQQIYSDFNITFDQALIGTGALGPLECTDGGDESSLALSVVNNFRLMQCIPFFKNFPWAPFQRNLYDWIKNANLSEINFFYAQDNEFNKGWDKRLYLRANSLGDPMYRKVTNTLADPAGLIDYVVLVAHETRHADINKGHDCAGTLDSSLQYMGAWAVQYHLWKMLSENTSIFFTKQQREIYKVNSQRILNSVFCSN